MGGIDALNPELRRYTYLDTVGRPVLIIQLSNVVDHFAGEFLVHYRMRPFAAVREPALLVGAVDS